MLRILGKDNRNPMSTPMIIKVMNTKETATSDMIIIADILAIAITVIIVSIVCSRTQLGVKEAEDTMGNKDTMKMIKKDRIASIFQGNNTMLNLRGKSILNLTVLRASKAIIASVVTKNATAK